MKMNRPQLIPALIFMILSIPVFAGTIIIPDQYPTIQQGINASVNGDTILIRPGTYLENILVDNKNLVIGSLFLITADTGYVSQTIIDGNRAGSVFRLSNISSGFVLSGITVTNGRSTGGGGISIINSIVIMDHIHIEGNISICGARDNYGGGIASIDSQIEIRNFIIKDNLADCNIPPINPLGGGLYGRNSTIHLKNGTLFNNQSFLGGGIFLDQCDLSISDINLKYNNAPWPGGTICAFDSDMDIEGSIFDSNSGTGGTIYADNSQQDSFNFRIINSLFVNDTAVIRILGHCLFEVINCTFANNHIGPSIIFYGNDLQVINSIFWNGFTQEIQIESSNYIAFIGYTDINGGKEGISNNASVSWIGPVYDTLPGFVNASVYKLSDQSPCIGAGIDSLTVYPFLAAPDIDLDSNIRPDPAGSMPDLGAYENPLANPLTGIKERNSFRAQDQFIIYPNPAGKFLRIANQSGQPIHDVQFTDVTGKELFHLSGINLSKDNELLIETGRIKARGFIFVVLWTDDQRFYSKLILNDL